MTKEFTKKLVLDDGREFYGHGFGADCESLCELVFNTSTVGYQEILSDLSYTDQMIVMAYPLIGNYGIAGDDYETKFPSIGGLVVREYNANPSNFRSALTLGEMMEEMHIPGIAGVDTRALIRILREGLVHNALLTDAETPTEEAMARIRAYKAPHDQVARVSCKKRWISCTPDHRYTVVAIDCGIKHNIVRALNHKGCNVTVVPWDTTAEEIMSFRPTGVLVSNGPGNPKDLGKVTETVKQLIGRVPIFGICMGHHIIAQAYGAGICRLKFGHHGGNHPVRDLDTGRVDITSQNHNFAVDEASVAGTRLRVTHINLLDGTVEGLECRQDKIYSVQFHPESAPGPQDATYLFDKFIKMMEEQSNG